MKSTLIDENKKLKRELDESYLSNFIISRETKFFSDSSSIEKLLDFGLNQKTIMKEYRKKVKDHLQF